VAAVPGSQCLGREPVDAGARAVPRRGQFQLHRGGLRRCSLHSTFLQLVRAHAHERGLGNWGQHVAGEKKLVEGFAWDITVTKVGLANSAPFARSSKAHGVQADRVLLYNFPTYGQGHKSFEIDRHLSGSETSRRWMVQRKPWTELESIASGADLATELLVYSECTAESPTEADP